MQRTCQALPKAAASALKQMHNDANLEAGMQERCHQVGDVAFGDAGWTHQPRMSAHASHVPGDTGNKHVFKVPGSTAQTVYC